MILETLPLTDGMVRWCPQFISPQQAASLFDQLRTALCWRQQSIRLRGQTLPQPRLSAWYGDPDAYYRYSGLKLEPLSWEPVLSELRQRLRNAVGHDFNSVLANLYRDGHDSMGWHSDDEPELGPQPVIASLSLGATRRFQLRHKRNGTRYWLDLGDGSLLVMAGTLQRHWRHCIAKTRRPVGARINLTFRLITDPAQSRANDASDST